MAVAADAVKVSGSVREQVKVREVATLALSLRDFPVGVWARVELEAGGQKVPVFLGRNQIGLNCYSPMWPPAVDGPFFTVIPYGHHAVAAVGQMVMLSVNGGAPREWLTDERGAPCIPTVSGIVRRIHLCRGEPGAIPVDLLRFDPDAPAAPARVPAPPGSSRPPAAARAAAAAARVAGQVLGGAARYPAAKG